MARGIATITILTDPVAAATEAVERAEVSDGTVLAEVLRNLADRVEQDIAILPTARNDEWIPETHRHAVRLHGVLIGSVIELTREA